MAEETNDDFFARTKGAPTTASTPPPQIPDDFLLRTGKAPAALPAWATTGAPGPAMTPTGIPAQPPSTFVNDPAGAGSRIWNATRQAYTDIAGANLLTPPARQWLDQGTLLDKYVLGPVSEIVGDVGSRVLGGANALLRGGQQTVYEGLSPLDPRLARDVAAYPESLGPEAVPKVGFGAMPKYAGPRSFGAADDIASAGYKTFDQTGLKFSPEYVNAGLDETRPTTPRGAAAEAITGQTPVTDMQDKLDAFRDKPMSGQQYQGLMEGFRKVINDQYQDGSMTSAGRDLMQMRENLRNHFEGASEGDILSGSTEDLSTLKDANKAYSQARKMELLEKMQDYASQTANPTTSIKQQVRTFLRKDEKTAGWSDDEIQALRDAADRGSLGDAMHFVGSRLGGVLAGGAALGADTFFHGSPTLGGAAAALLAGGAGYLEGAPFRGAVNWASRRGVQNALDTLGQGVPPLSPSP